MKRIVVALAVAVLAAVLLWHPPNRPAIVASTVPAASRPPGRTHARRSGAPAQRSVVYVVGAIARPGLYRMAPDARVDDAVRAAGGLTPNADPAGVNLAAHVNDGDEIEVPIRGETVAPRAKRARGKRSQKTTSVVNVNTANAGELAQVPGIGKTLAARIVAVRARDGAFTSFDQLLDVAGMTQSRLDRAQDFLHL